MLQRLELVGADDHSVHLTRLQHLTPETAGRVILRHRIRTGQRYELIRDEFGQVRFQELGRKDPERHILIDSHAANWYFEGEPPVEGYPGAQLRYTQIYRSLLPFGQQLCETNLRRTDSFVALAGQGGGRAVTEQVLSSIRLRVDTEEAALSELLAVYGWQPLNVSRIRYFNPRAGTGKEFDRPGPPPGLMIADGPTAFEAVYDHPEVLNSNVVAVVSRTADPDQLDRLAQRVEALAQWYDPDPDIATELPVPPAGVEIMTLRRES